MFKNLKTKLSLEMGSSKESSSQDENKILNNKQSTKLISQTQCLLNKSCNSSSILSLNSNFDSDVDNVVKNNNNNSFKNNNVKSETILEINKPKFFQKDRFLNKKLFKDMNSSNNSLECDKINNKYLKNEKQLETLKYWKPPHKVLEPLCDLKNDKTNYFYNKKEELQKSSSSSSLYSQSQEFENLKNSNKSIKFIKFIN